MDVKAKILQVNRKETASGKTMYSVQFRDMDTVEDKWINVFTDIQGRAFQIALNKNLSIEMTLLQKGDYLNLASINTDIKDDEGVTVDVAPPKPKGGFAGGAKADPGKIKSIERQSALKQAVYLVGQGQVKLADLEEIADRVYAWLVAEPVSSDTIEK